MVAYYMEALKLLNAPKIWIVLIVMVAVYVLRAMVKRKSLVLNVMEIKNVQRAMVDNIWHVRIVTEQALLIVIIAVVQEKWIVGFAMVQEIVLIAMAQVQ